MLKISSKDRSQGTASNDFSIQFSDPVPEGKYKLVYAAIPLTFYNITSLNNKIYFLENVTPFTATVPTGNYTSSTLTAAISTALDAAGAYTYTTTIDPTTLRITITSSDAKASFSDGTNSMNYTIGFPASTTAGLTHTGTGMINLFQVRNLHIHVDRDSQSKDSKSRYFSFILPVYGAFGEVLYRTDKDLTDQYVKFDSSLYNMKVTLRDDAQNLVDLNGLDYDFVLKKC